jgi:hypothetical protein
MIGEVISNLRAFIYGSMSREKFSIWFYGVSRKAEKRFGGASLEFIRDIEGTFAEASSGNWSNHDLVDELESLLSRFHNDADIISFSFPKNSNVTSASSGMMIGFPVWQLK